MALRNFWLEGQVDGMRTKIETGPRAADGGFQLKIKMRENGGIKDAVTITGIATVDGVLALWVQMPDGVEHSPGGRYLVETER